MNLRALVVALPLLLPVALAPSGRAGAAPVGKLAPAKDPADAQMKKLLDAVKTNDYAAFLADGTPKQRSLDKRSFNLVSVHFAPMLLKGYKTTFLATLRKPDNTTHLWKLEPAGGKEDFVIKLVVIDGKVDVFSIQ
jgi:hypothetical protein